MAIKNASQTFVPIQEIRNGVIILNDGGMRAILSSTSLNLSLKSEDEQLGIIVAFQSFLNSLDFNVQIFIESKNVDVRDYIATLEERESEVTEELLKIQIKEYISFIKRFTEEQNIMTKNFYLVIPYNIPSLINSQKRMSDMDFIKNENQLMQRVSVVVSGLSALGLKLKLLDTEEAVSLFYKLFNPNELNSPNLKSN